MKKKKIFVAILFAVLACFVFTGCSSQENSKTEGKSQGETAANTPREQDRPDLLGKVKSVAEDSLIVFKSEDMQPPEQGEGGPFTRTKKAPLLNKGKRGLSNRAVLGNLLGLDPDRKKSHK